MSVLRLLPLLLVSTSGLAACSGERGGSSDTSLAGELRRREATRVRVGPVEQREMVRTLATTTVVESQNAIVIVPRMVGIVDTIHVEEGDRVEAGTVLAVMDQRAALTALDEAKLALRGALEELPRLALAKKEAAERQESARLTWEQGKRDVEANEKAGLISKNELDKLRLGRETAYREFRAATLAHERAIEEEKGGQTAVERAKLAVTREELNLSFTEITAPFAGAISSRSIKVGDMVSQAAGEDGAFTITDADNLRCVIYRPQRELPFFDAARAATDGAGGARTPIEIRIAAEAIPDVEFDGHIEIVSPTIDATSGSFRVTIKIDQPSEESGRPRLMPGMLVRLSIVTERHPDALVVPKRALRREGDTHFVFAVRDDRACRIEVAEGFSTDEDVEIVPVERDSLTAGEAVVVVGNRDLDDGEEVTTETWSADGDGVQATTLDETVAAESDSGGQ